MTVDDSIHQLKFYINAGKFMEALEQIQQIEKQELPLDAKLEIDLLKSKVSLELGEIEETRKLVQSVLKLSKEKQKRTKYLKGLTLEIGLNILEGNINQALIGIEEFEREIQTILDRERRDLEEEIGYLHYEKGNIYLRKGNYDLAIEEFKQYYTVCKQKNLRRNFGLAAYQLGESYRILGKNELAVDYLNEALRVFEEINYYEGIAGVYKALEQLYMAIGDSDMAFSYAQKKKDLDVQVQLKNELLKSARIITRLNREIEQLNRERIDLEQKILSLEFSLNAEVGQFQVDMKESHTKESSLDYKREGEELATLIETKEIEIENLKIELQNLSEQLSEENEKKEETTHKLLKLEEERQNLWKKIEGLERELERANKKVEEFTRIIDRKEELIKKLEEAVSEKDSKLKKLDEKLTALQKDHQEDINELILGQKEELAYFEKKFVKQERIIKEKDMEISKLAIQLQKIIDERQKLEMRIKKLSEGRTDEKNQSDQFKDTIKVLEGKVKKLEQRKEVLEKRLESRELELANFRGRITTLTTMLNESEQEKEQIVLNLSRAMERIEDLKEKISKLVKENEQLQEEILASRDRRIEEEELDQPPIKAVERIPIMRSTVQQQKREQLQTPEALKLADSIEQALQIQSEIKLRRLAMNAGIAPFKALEAIKELEKAGLVDVIYFEKDDLNPTIKKK